LVTLLQKALAVGLGFVGMLMALSIVHGIQDHQALHAVIQMINQAQTQQAPK
jgi:hypothetical protein